ncbi:2-dehydro-3-deoxy-D-gluconate 5-dehydrogenase KduD [Jannaschia sp. W003]|uniref:2-dehydro-3-deoxy-D-gluconate 5-dehydrogenase KduD n=1 Tax=Jannaschia sp. W003 TaxID=2867012 RepID=UPI0021A6E338|nr:2-dehydro-3-deoxy-D-gluconate 5-dehydrogenase KduD [Jannaschia sp. W003]UWQ23200.1 2-dehydro-3-deoxy-D-gluconate 5-dehydrogenase KduD [Jannaschia sp. W003]
MSALAGRRAFVTGANTGIGQAVAVDLAAAGAEVLCAGRSAMDETLAAIAAAGGQGHAVPADLGTMAEARAAFEGAEAAHGPVDVLVNNAGIIRRADAVDMTEADWDAVLDVNLKAAFFLAQSFARSRLRAGGEGAVVNVASLLSFQGGIRVAGYTASKSGLAGLTRVLANEWAPHGITVNAVAPGYVETNNTAALRDDPERREAILARIPMGRWARPADIAGAVTFLAGPGARYVTGVTLPVDGGWLAR